VSSATAQQLARRALFDVYRRERVSAWIRATGTSMHPCIAPGEWMRVDFGAQPERVGEIVLFCQGEQLVAHRVVGWRRTPGGRHVVAKGDAVAYCDPAVAPGDVLGVVRAISARRAGAPRTAGCGGARARAVGTISGWRGRAAWKVRRIVRGGTNA
jgi:hypothetical protein